MRALLQQPRNAEIIETVTLAAHQYFRSAHRFSSDKSSSLVPLVAPRDSDNVRAATVACSESDSDRTGR